MKGRLSDGLRERLCNDNKRKFLCGSSQDVFFHTARKSILKKGQGHMDIAQIVTLSNLENVLLFSLPPRCKFHHVPETGAKVVTGD